MNKTIGTVLLILFLGVGNVYANDVTTVKAKDDDISENLDLKAVASIFAESKDIEDFEKKLNDPETQISNLDLNEDGEVDYLRVMETSKGDTHLVTIQAVIGEDQFQDVATIDVEKKGKDQTQIQVVGDVYMYGPGYIIEPVYVHPPVIYLFFWGAFYRPWHSPFYWGHYPPYYRPWRPYPSYRYRKNVNIHINVNNSYRYTSVRKSKTSIELNRKQRRNDLGAKHPNRSFNKRNKKVNNQQGIGRNKKTTRPAVQNAPKSTGKKVQKDWKPTYKKSGNKSTVNKHISAPSGKITTKPAARKPENTMKSNQKDRKQHIGRPSPNRSSNRPNRRPRQ